MKISFTVQSVLILFYNGSIFTIISYTTGMESWKINIAKIIDICMISLQFCVVWGFSIQLCMYFELIFVHRGRK